MDFYDTLPETIQFCLLINAAFYIGWKLYETQMAKHATSSDENLSSGRVWSLLLSAFSHKSLLHLALNMYGFLSIGPTLLRAMGVRLFLISVITAAVFSSLLPLLYNRVVVRLFPGSRRLAAKKFEVHLGFSGVNSALLLLYALIQPHAQFTSPFAAFVDGSTSGTVDALSFLRSCMLGDLLGLGMDLAVTSTGISHAGHIGGFLGGYAVQQFVTETDLGRRLTPWNTRRKMDVDLWSKLGMGS
jgi:membrane associated rhomboid family serine protease